VEIKSIFSFGLQAHLSDLSSTMEINCKVFCKIQYHSSKHHILLYKVNLKGPEETYKLGFLNIYNFKTYASTILWTIFHLLIYDHFCEAKVRNFYNIYILN